MPNTIPNTEPTTLRFYVQPVEFMQAYYLIASALGAVLLFGGIAYFISGPKWLYDVPQWLQIAVLLAIFVGLVIGLLFWRVCVCRFIIYPDQSHGVVVDGKAPLQIKGPFRCSLYSAGLYQKSRRLILILDNGTERCVVHGLLRYYESFPPEARGIGSIQIPESIPVYVTLAGIKQIVNLYRLCLEQTQ